MQLFASSWLWIFRPTRRIGAGKARQMIGSLIYRVCGSAGSTCADPYEAPLARDRFLRASRVPPFGIDQMQEVNGIHAPEERLEKQLRRTFSQSHSQSVRRARPFRNLPSRHYPASALAKYRPHSNTHRKSIVTRVVSACLTKRRTKDVASYRKADSFVRDHSQRDV